LTHELDLELQRRGLPNDFWQIAPALFGTEDVADSFAIDVASFVDRKLHALRAHRTQIGANNAFAALDDGLAARFLGVERFAQLNAAYDWLKAALADD
jgi:LmbE family N-acetylglucosaminyl deacetylase